MSTNDLITSIKPILKKHKVSKADIFGSMAYGEETNKSDVDLLVEMPHDATLLGFVRLKRDLEEKLSKKVDLVEYGSVNSQFAPYVFSKTVAVL